MKQLTYEHSWGGNSQAQAQMQTLRHFGEHRKKYEWKKIKKKKTKNSDIEKKEA